MTDVVITQKTFKPDPLGRKETDVVERLHAMAEDALAKQNQEEVDREAEIARSLFGFRR